MTEEQTPKRPHRKRGGGSRSENPPAGWRSWTSAALGAFVLVLCGFVLGIVLGVVAEEPDVVVSHLVGGSEQVSWDSTLPPGAVSAPPPAARPAGRAAEDSAGGSASQLADARVVQAPLVSAAIVSAPIPSPSASPGARQAPSAPTAVAPEIARGASSASAPSDGWAVQVGAFSRSSAADALAESLRAKGFDSYLTPSAGPSGGRWRVRVGPLESQDEARRLAQRLEREESLSTWVLSEGGG